ncbi:hypothetical protein [Maridesulfovibrio sp.]|uniref:hypothetical protein n=1 Tax=Maridesulfovibrio sp. TaxID=2795000 RepID=UPI002A1894A1|nr:hypothetical protein [Maridesulfovibrio sp.]
MKLANKHIPHFKKYSRSNYEQLRAASLSGDISSLNAMGIIKEREGDIVTAFSLYYMALTLFKKFRSSKRLYMWEEKNRNIIESNAHRLWLCIDKDDFKELSINIENVESDYGHVTEIFGVSAKFENGLKYSLKDRHFYFGHFSKYSPFFSMLLFALVLQILNTVSIYYPDSIGMGKVFYDQMFGMVGAFFMAFLFFGFAPIVNSSWVVCKVFLWIGSYFLAGELGESLAKLYIHYAI